MLGSTVDELEDVVVDVGGLVEDVVVDVADEELAGVDVEPVPGSVVGVVHPARTRLRAAAATPAR